MSGLITLKMHLLFLKPEAIMNRHVLVLDDVITSGATTSALCAQVLKHQPKSICVYALAYKV